jgi:quercetin dioxygenase-like cupin family protein
LPNRTRSWTTRISIILPCVLLSLLLGATAAAQEQTSDNVFQNQAVFNVPDAPDAPYHVHQSILLFEPGAEAPLHQHGGPGYITILEGQLTLYEDGEENVYRAGDSLVETPDKLYKGGNFTDADTVLIVTYLVPEGEEVTTVVDDPDAPEPPEIAPVPIAEAMYEFTDPPDSFDLVHSTTFYEAGTGTGPGTAQGDTLLTAVSGDMELTVNGESSTVPHGDVVLIERDQEYSLHNTTDDYTVTMSVELAPDVHSIAPAAGSTVDRTLVIWLIVMTGLTLLVVGGVLRLSSLRMR